SDRVDRDLLLFASDLFADADLLGESANVAHLAHGDLRASSRSIVRIRAMVVRSLRISPGLRGAPPIAATPRAFMSSLRVSLSLSVRPCGDMSRSSFVLIRPSLSLDLLQLV